MEYKIVWTSFAKKQLHDVFRYYADKANQEIADIFDTRQQPNKIRRSR